MVPRRHFENISSHESEILPSGPLEPPAVWPRYCWGFLEVHERSPDVHRSYVFGANTKLIKWSNGSYLDCTNYWRKPRRWKCMFYDHYPNGMLNPSFRKLPGTFEDDNLCFQSLRDLGEVFRKLLEAFRTQFGMPCEHWKRRKVRKIKICDARVYFL